MVRFTRYLLYILPGLLMLAACGSAAEPAAQSPSPAPNTQTPRPAASTAAPSPAAQPAPTALAAQPSLAPSAVSPDAAGGIPESTTPEGYHILGRADAPVTLTMYSDFL